MKVRLAPSLLKDKRAGESEKGKAALAPGLATYNKRRGPVPGSVLSYAIVLLIVSVYLFPLAYLINTALKKPGEFLFDPTSLAKTFYLGNFSDAWVRADFASNLYNSLLYTLVSTVISTALSLLLAFPIARGYIKWSGFWYTLFVVSLFLPNALIPQFQLILNLGLYDTQIGYILLQAGAVGLGPFLMVGYLKAIPKELDEVAAIDGCGYWRYLWEVIVPLTKPVLVTVFLFHAIQVWNDIIGPTVYLPNPDYTPATLGLFAFYGLYTVQWTALAAATLILALPLVALYLFFQRYFIEGAIGSAFKS